MDTFQRELEALINRYSLENGSNTPDFILAQYLQDCLVAYERLHSAKEAWYAKAEDEDNTVDVFGSGAW